MTATQNRKRRTAAEAPPDPTPEPDENETAEEGEGDETQPEHEPGSVEAQQGKIDNAQRKYRKDLEGIVGDLGDADWCPMCSGLGFVELSTKMAHRGDTQRCETCKGLGQLLTGSRAPGHEQIACTDCSGTGHVFKVTTAAPVEAAAQVHQLPLPPQQVHGWWDPATSTFHAYAEAAPS